MDSPCLDASSISSNGSSTENHPPPSPELSPSPTVASFVKMEEREEIMTEEEGAEKKTPPLMQITNGPLSFLSQLTPQSPSVPGLAAASPQVLSPPQLVFHHLLFNSLNNLVLAAAAQQQTNHLLTPPFGLLPTPPSSTRRQSSERRPCSFASVESLAQSDAPRIEEATTLGTPMRRRGQGNTMVREIKCPTCHKSFTRPWLLQNHIRVHTGEKPYGCHVCKKFFADKSNLRAHVQTHSGAKPYSCARCGKSFALKAYLSKHEESSCLRAQALSAFQN